MPNRLDRPRAQGWMVREQQRREALRQIRRGRRRRGDEGPTAYDVNIQAQIRHFNQVASDHLHTRSAHNYYGVWQTGFDAGAPGAYSTTGTITLTGATVTNGAYATPLTGTLGNEFTVTIADPVRCYHDLSDQALLSDPDPDALVRHVIADLIRHIQEEASVPIDADQIWIGWVVEPELASTRIEAEWNDPRAYPGSRIEQTWMRWVNEPPTVRVYRDGRYVLLEGAEARREIHAKERQALIARNRSRAQTLRRKIAARKAEELLVACLGAEQAREWEQQGCFHVETADGNRRYRIRHGVQGNIELVKDGRREAAPGRFLRRYCWHTDDVPVADNVLAQALHLQDPDGHAQFERERNLA